ncbi:alpha-L-fucosidase [Sediminicola luteus]|uniref:alpha-L-fucosidase n=1 Tax=Sediminicola luteus TaxID=319238 RepID=A0A2A4GDE6_9FLAO|nr:alpha-L-fucosidase [Sediminicola luteus]PCE66004.1 hypothetical protein B7P33_01500 [Sediminicola luteus]
MAVCNNRLIIIMGLFCLYSIKIWSQLSGGGDLNPELKVPQSAQEQWRDLKVGLSVHWGPSSLGGKEISWSRHKKIPVAQYDAFYKDFAPTEFDAREWVDLLKRWGMKYISPTAKHHDGFALWFSKWSRYDMEEAGLKLDIMQELKQACDEAGIVLGAYYSNIDWYHPDWTPNVFGGPGTLFETLPDAPNMDRYLKYMYAQCAELIEDYGVGFIQFDGEWDETYTHQMGSKMYRDLRALNENVLLSTRIDIGRRMAGKDNHIDIDGSTYAGDFQDRERLVNHGNNVTVWGDHAWQAWVTLDKKQWSFNKSPDLMTAQELILDLVQVVGNNGNYMINLGPKPNGSFPKEQVVLMNALGAWLDQYGGAIYGTRGGPYYPFQGGVSTRKGQKAWLFLWEGQESITLPKLSQPILGVVDYKSREPVTVTENKTEIVIDLKALKKEGTLQVLELRYKGSPQMQAR